MKKVKLMALGLMVMMIQSVGAVTLPSTSYTPYSPGESYGGAESGIVFSSGSMVAGTYSPLSANGSGYIESTCSGKWNKNNDPTGVMCSECCSETIDQLCENDDDPESCYAEYESDRASCDNYCDAIPMAPIDGGLSILLALAIGSGAVRAFKRRK